MFDPKYFKREVMEAVGGFLKQEFSGPMGNTQDIGTPGERRCEVRVPEDKKSVQMYIRGAGQVRMFVVTIKETM